jgi:hypothetical protein
VCAHTCLQAGCMSTRDPSNLDTATLSAWQTPEVDLPVEEFFFRLEPAVEQLLSQGVPAAYCNINVHHHLRRSYEMLASVRVQPVLALPQHQAASMSSKPLKSNRSSPPRCDTSDPSDTGFRGGGGKQPWRITQPNTCNRSATGNNQPRSKW